MTQNQILISADSHINEHPNLFVDRVPTKFKERCPRTIDLDNGGEGWLFEGSSEAAFPLGLTAVVHRASKRYDRAEFRKRFEEYRDGYQRGVRYEDILPGSYEPGPRVKEQIEDRVDAEILYQGPLVWAAVKELKDRELQLACFRAYNDWMAEFNAHDPKRLVGPGLVPATGIEDALRETRRCVLELGMKSVTLESWPNGSLTEPSPEDDRFWDLAVQLNIPVNVHVGFSLTKDAGKNFATGGFEESPAERREREMRLAGGNFPSIVSRMMLTGVFDRFPSLKFIGAEVYCGWIPSYFENFDQRVRKAYSQMSHRPQLLPSEYFKRNILVTFIGDYYGVLARNDIGIDNIMWSSDFPHSVSSWPIDADIAEDQLQKGLATPEESNKVLWKTCADLYRLTV